MYDSKLVQLIKWRDNQLTWDYIMLFILLINLGLSLRKLADMSAEIQDIEKLIKIDCEDIQWRTNFSLAL